MLKLKLQYLGHLIRRANSLEKTLPAGEDWGQEEKGVTEDETVGWHHQLSGHEFEQAGRWWRTGKHGMLGWRPGGAGVCVQPHEELDPTEHLNNNKPLLFLVRKTKSTGRCCEHLTSNLPLSESRADPRLQVLRDCFPWLRKGGRGQGGF